MQCHFMHHKTLLSAIISIVNDDNLQMKILSCPIQSMYNKLRCVVAVNHHQRFLALILLLCRCTIALPACRDASRGYKNAQHITIQ